MKSCVIKITSIQKRVHIFGVIGQIEKPLGLSLFSLSSKLAFEYNTLMELSLVVPTLAVSKGRHLILAICCRIFK